MAGLVEEVAQKRDVERYMGHICLTSKGSIYFLGLLDLHLTLCVYTACGQYTCTVGAGSLGTGRSTLIRMKGLKLRLVPSPWTHS